MLHLELGGDWRRFSSPRKLSSWLGLTPSLRQSGESESQGAITKTGSGIARRLLVESAWHYAREPRIGATLANRQAGQPDHVLQIAWRAQHRLHRVGKRLRERGKPGNVATVCPFLDCARRRRSQRPGIANSRIVRLTPSDVEVAPGSGHRAT
jgi:transposase